MVVVHAYAQCAQCAHKAYSRIGSGDGSDGAHDCSLFCDHFDCHTEEYTQRGWFFGANAECDIYFVAICNRCDNKQKINHFYSGWPTGNSHVDTLSCCGNSVRFSTGENDHWLKLVRYVHPGFAIMALVGGMVSSIPMGKTNVKLFCEHRIARGCRLKVLHPFCNDPTMFSNSFAQCVKESFGRAAIDYGIMDVCHEVNVHSWVILEAVYNKTGETKYICCVWASSGYPWQRGQIQLKNFDSDWEGAIANGYRCALACVDITREMKLQNSLPLTPRPAKSGYYVWDVFNHVKEVFEGKRYVLKYQNCNTLTKYVLTEFGVPLPKEKSWQHTHSRDAINRRSRCAFL